MRLLDESRADFRVGHDCCGRPCNRKRDQCALWRRPKARPANLTWQAKPGQAGQCGSQQWRNRWKHTNAAGAQQTGGRRPAETTRNQSWRRKRQAHFGQELRNTRQPQSTTRAMGAFKGITRSQEALLRARSVQKRAGFRPCSYEPFCSGCRLFDADYLAGLQRFDPSSCGSCANRVGNAQSRLTPRLHPCSNGCWIQLCVMAAKLCQVFWTHVART